MTPCLHLGCGGHHLPAPWINADVSEAPLIEGRVYMAPDCILDLCDLSALPSAQWEWIYSSHTIEHVPPDLLPNALVHLHRSLLPGGRLTLATTDLIGIYNHRFIGHGNGRAWESALFGDTSSTAHPSASHKDVFTYDKLEWLLRRAGFATVRPWDLGQYPEIDALNDYAKSCRLVSVLIEGVK